MRRHPIYGEIPPVDEAGPDHWYWDSLGHDYGPWSSLHRCGDIATQSRRRLIYYKRCDAAVKDKVALMNAQAIVEREQAIDDAKKRNPLGNRQVSFQDRVEELFTDAGKIVDQSRSEIDALYGKHLSELSEEQQRHNEEAFDADAEERRFGEAFKRFGYPKPLEVPEFLRRSRQEPDD